jgi:hypothetical protein
MIEEKLVEKKTLRGRERQHVLSKYQMFSRPDL